jgi:hypothetical protein
MVRNLKDFEATFHAHVMGSPRKTRGWIERDRSRDALLKAAQGIATHCVVKSMWFSIVTSGKAARLGKNSARLRLGDTSAAETRQRGLIALAEHLGLGCRQEFDPQEELIHRYIMLKVASWYGAVSQYRAKRLDLTSEIRAITID